MVSFMELFSWKFTNLSCEFTAGAYWADTGTLSVYIPTGRYIQPTLPEFNMYTTYFPQFYPRFSPLAAGRPRPEVREMTPREYQCPKCSDRYVRWQMSLPAELERKKLANDWKLPSQLGNALRRKRPVDPFSEIGRKSNMPVDESA